MQKIISIMLICIIIIFSVFSFSFAEENEEVENEVEENSVDTELKEEQENLQDKISGAEEELEYVQEELSKNLIELQELDERIATSKVEIEEVNIEIQSLQLEVEEVESKLNIVQIEYDEKKLIYDERMIALYEMGETEYLDILFESNNISDFVSNYYMITQMAEHDTELIEELEKVKNEIEIEKKKLDNQKETLATLKENQLRATTILENTITIRESFVSRLSEEEQKIKADIDEYTKLFAEVNSQILETALKSLDEKYIGGTLDWPVPGYTRITSEYGMRDHPVTGIYKLHTGIDIAAPTGANFIAVNSGVVVTATYNAAYGNMVIVDHGGGVSTLYAHGSEILVSVGQTVNRGDVVLKVGNTGYSTGPHAHFEVRLNGITTDPFPYITNGIVPEAQNIE